jgi:tetratricopeptide (TPR) repeat protein
MCVLGGNIPQLSVSSTDEEWATAGHEFFANRNYSQATRAFKRAGLLREAEASYTHQLRDTARSIQPFNKAAKRDAFRSAADSFLKCARGAQGEQRRVFFHNAADCFENAGNYGDKKEDLDYLKAARAYKAASEYTSAVRLYKQMEMFDDAVRVIREHQDDLDEELANNVWDLARLFYFKNKELG